MEDDLQFATAAVEYSDCVASGGSTPYVSAPSSPGRDAPHAGFYYSAPASPTHFMLSTATLASHRSTSSSAAAAANSSFEFDFSSPEHMTSADELFFNGQIRPMKLATHLRRPQLLSPLIESDDVVVEDDRSFCRNSSFRAGSLRRRTRSMSPDRTTSLQYHTKTQNDDSPSIINTNPDTAKTDDGSNETTPSGGGRSSRRWVFLKEFLYRSKSEGHKFWGSLSSFSPVKEKKITPPLPKVIREGKKPQPVNRRNYGKRTVAPPQSPSPHELHYTANRAQAEEMRKKTFLPYRHGLFGSAVNGFARALNSVSSR